MKKVFALLVSLFILCSASSYAKEIKMAIGMALPPYIITESNTGIEYDIIKEALKFKGHTIKPEYLPFARVPYSIKDKSVDAAATISESSGITDVFYSNSHITYQNVAICLSSKNYKIEKIADLAGKNILAFQEAKKYLGEEFAKSTADSKLYSEIANQELQVAMLYRERTDVIVMDINIFLYFKQKTKVISTNAPISINKVFGSTQYKVAFTDKKICDDFNEGLEKLKSSGEYDKIIKKYIK